MTLLAHSAGGWLGRLYLLGFGTAGIDRLVSIGSPHQPPPQVSMQSKALQVVCAPVRRLAPAAWDSGLHCCPCWAVPQLGSLPGQRRS